MAVPVLRTTRTRVVAAVGAATVALALGAAAPADAQAASTSGAGYRQTNLISSVPGLARVLDPNLKNPWGISFRPGSASSPGSPLWTSNEATSTTTLYTGQADHVPTQAIPLVVATPQGPTGTVYNDTTEFLLPTGAPAAFLFSTESGKIVGWAGAAPPPTTTTTLVDHPGAVFLGLALLHTPNGARLLANDAVAGVVRIYDGTFHEIGVLDRSGVDPAYAPYNVTVLGSHVYVTYATLDGSLPGQVDVYTTSMRSHRTLISGGRLAAPWGMAIAPDHWGPFSHALLVGNVADGKINAYDRMSGRWLGVLKGADGMPLVNSGLWGIAFGNGTIGTRHTLIIAAGINGYADGLVAGIRYGHG